MGNDPSKEIFAAAKAADERVADAKREYDVATALRADHIAELAERGLSRATIARELGMSITRVQQILDRTRARTPKINLEEATHRVVVTTTEGDELRLALVDVHDLILFGGHGVGTAPPGGPLPEVDTWSIYAQAESDADAKEKVVAAVASRLVNPIHVRSVEPFEPDA